MIMKTREENFFAIRQCVLTDYPYPIDWEDREVQGIFNATYDDIIEQHSHICNRYYNDGNTGLINLNFLDHYVILAYRFANALWKNNLPIYAEAVYFSLRIRGSLDLFYTTDIDKFFMPTHSLGAVIDSHVKYGKLFKVYNGCHLGPYNIVGVDPKEWKHPKVGDYVTMLGGSKLFGETTVGNNVIISVNTVVVNEEIPDNCIVSGISPNLVFQRLNVSNSSLLTNV